MTHPAIGRPSDLLSWAMRRALVVSALVVAGIAGGVGGGAASSQSGFTFDNRYDEVVPGRTEVFAGYCESPTVTVSLANESTVLVEASAAADGGFEVSFVTPEDIPDGTYTITGTCGSETATVEVEVAHPSAPEPVVQADPASTG